MYGSLHIHKPIQLWVGPPQKAPKAGHRSRDAFSFAHLGLSVACLKTLLWSPHTPSSQRSWEMNLEREKILTPGSEARDLGPGIAPVPPKADDQSQAIRNRSSKMGSGHMTRVSQPIRGRAGVVLFHQSDALSLLESPWTMTSYLGTGAPNLCTPVYWIRVSIGQDMCWKVLQDPSLLYPRILFFATETQGW